MNENTEEKIGFSKRKKKSDPLTDIFLQCVADELKPEEWKLLGRLLEVRNLEHIDHDFQKYGIAEVMVQMLKAWKFQNGSRATYEVLKSALMKIRRSDIIDNVLKRSDITTSIYEDIDDDRFSDHVQVCQEKLIQMYCDLELPRVFWFEDRVMPLSELYVDLTLYSIDCKNPRNFRFNRNATKEVTSDKTYFQLQDLFESLDGVSPRRILIEGHPGYGKTTLVCKIASDWANGESYLREKFTLVFVVILRYFTVNLEESIIQQSEVGNLDISRVLGEMGENILLILDGFDELSEDSKCMLVPLLTKDIFPSATVILTTRTDEMQFPSSREKSSVFYRIGAKTKEGDCLFCWDKRIQIEGISKANREKFFKNYFHGNLRELDEISDSVFESLSNICEGPLFLLLLAIVIEEKNADSINTKTKLYKEVSNYLINRYLAKEEGTDENDQNINIFEGEDIKSTSYRSLLTQFGELSLKKLKANSLSFSKHEITEYCSKSELIWRLGFLAKNSAFQNRKVIHYYEPIHKTFLEFFSAFFVYTTCFEDKQKFRTLVYSLLDDSFFIRQTLLFCSFLVGLMGDDAHVLFNSLSPVAPLMPFYFVKEAYEEMEVTKNNISAFLPFFPPVWKILREDPFYATSSHASLLEFANQNGRLECLVWPLGIPVNFPAIVQVPCLHVYANKNVDLSISSFERIISDEVSYFYNSSLRCGGEMLIWEGNMFPNIYINILHETGFKQITFSGYRLNMEITKLPPDFPQGMWKDQTLSRLACRLSIDSSIAVILELISKNKIYELFEYSDSMEKMYIKKDTPLQSLFNAAIESTYLKSIALKLDGYWKIKTQGIEIDFLHLCDANKMWEFLYVNPGIQWRNFERSDRFLHVKVIVFSEHRRQIDQVADIEVLFLCDALKAVSLPISFFNVYAAKAKSRSWQGLDTITEIEFIMDATLDPIAYECLWRFKNLKIITLKLQNVCAEEVDKLLKGIKKMKLVCLNFFFTRNRRDESLGPFTCILKTILSNAGHGNKFCQNLGIFPLETYSEEIFVLIKQILECYACNEIMYMLNHDMCMWILANEKIRENLVFKSKRLTCETSKFLTFNTIEPVNALSILYSEHSPK